MRQSQPIFLVCFYHLVVIKLMTYATGKEKVVIFSVTFDPIEFKVGVVVTHMIAIDKVMHKMLFLLLASFCVFSDR